jgi:hypothetical protein
MRASTSPSRGHFDDLSDHLMTRSAPLIAPPRLDSAARRAVRGDPGIAQYRPVGRFARVIEPQGLKHGTLPSFARCPHHWTRALPASHRDQVPAFRDGTLPLHQANSPVPLMGCALQRRAAAKSG